jgi:hypothetical protein
MAWAQSDSLHIGSTITISALILSVEVHLDHVSSWRQHQWCTLHHLQEKTTCHSGYLGSHLFGDLCLRQIWIIVSCTDASINREEVERGFVWFRSHGVLLLAASLQSINNSSTTTFSIKPNAEFHHGLYFKVLHIAKQARPKTDN